MVIPAEGASSIDFTANITSGSYPLDVLFTDTSSLPVIGDSRRWDFGDGAIAFDPTGTISHTYLQEGIFTVRLDRTDSEGYHSLIKYDYIAVTGPSPTQTTPVTTTPTTSPVTTATTVIPTTTQVTTTPTTVPTTQPTVQIPSEFFGQATLSGLPVPAGARITARIGSRNAGEVVVVSPGTYGGAGPFDQRLKVYATSSEIAAGPVLITFWLNEALQAPQTAYFQSGTSQNIALDFAGPTPTPTFTTPVTTTPTTSPVTTATTGSPTTTHTTAPTTSPHTTVTTVPTTGPTTLPTTSPTVTPTGVPGITLTFEPGWNHISIPRYLSPGSDSGSIFTSVDTSGRPIWRYNSTIQLYERVYPATHLNATDSIWVYSSSHVTLPLFFSGTQGLVERNLYSGWNGFGILNLTEVPARDALFPVYSSWKYSYGFDPIAQRYEVSIVNGGMGIHNDSRTLIPGKGYWLFMEENVTYRVFIPDS
ncbi:MAG TPA: PKD domain-containing protein [Methanolinea sp.]|nr:PKD domain-containing protein [Methanolinea sp.]HQK55342.1 PKD domain-containing protein [Methanolinea sp.]